MGKPVTLPEEARRTQVLFRGHSVLKSSALTRIGTDAAVRIMQLNFNRKRKEYAAKTTKRSPSGQGGT